jgi:hypothetical protein
MAWQTVAQGETFDGLEQLVADRTLKKGQQVRVVMDSPGYDWVWDAFGAEQVMSTQIPDGFEIVDVYGEGGKGYVDMVVVETGTSRIAGVSALPALIPLILAIAKWATIAIVVGFFLYLIVQFIRVLVWVSSPEGLPFLLIAGLVAGAAGIVWIARKRASPA